MAARMQIVIDANDPDQLARFWALALHYKLEEPPDGSATWLEYWRNRGLPEEELVGVDGYESCVDPEGVGPRIWFQPVPEEKSGKNRVHLDIAVTGGRSVPFAERRRRVDAEVERLVAAGASVAWPHDSEEIDHYAATLRDPEGNEFCVM
jgi:hypothetical protein